MGRSVGKAILVGIVLLVSASCGGHSDETSACADLCEIHAGCGYEIATCTERCETTLQDSSCETERRALLRCVQNQPRESVLCIEAGPFSSFGPRDATAGPCHEQDAATFACDCAHNDLVACP